jgi:hypothetical protein
MKKLIYLIFSLLLLQVSSFSQTSIIDEDFMDPVTGWEMENNWSQEEGYLMLYYYPIVENYDLSSRTPEFYVPANGGEIVFNMFIDVFLSSVTDEKCEISVVKENGDEDVVWTYDLSEGAWGSFSGEELTLSLDDYIGQNIRLRMRSYGSTTAAMWGWFLFNVEFTTWFDYELTAVNITGPSKLEIMEEGTWQIGVKNQGLMPESNFQVELYSFKTGQSIAQANYSNTLAAGQTANISLNWSADHSHNTVVYATIHSVNDEFQYNNQTAGHFVRIEPDLDYNVLIWNNDNGIATVEQPESGQLQRPGIGIEKALQAAGIEADYTTSLPANLENYDVILATMGCYCLS